MDEPSLRFLEILFEIFGSPPRQGPGILASARKALRHYENLPDAPEIIDLCCGTEGQTLQLAELTTGHCYSHTTTLTTAVRDLAAFG